MTDFVTRDSIVRKIWGDADTVLLVFAGCAAEFALNRAVAIGMAGGPQAGLDAVDRLTSEPALEEYHLLWSVRGDLLAKLGRTAEAKAEFERAASLTENDRERTYLLQRADACATSASR